MKNKVLKGTIYTIALLLGVSTYGQERGKRKGGSPDKLIEQLDADKDGKLSKEEISEAKREKLVNNFDKIDANSDGFLIAEELKKYMADTRKKGSQ